MLAMVCSPVQMGIGNRLPALSICGLPPRIQGKIGKQIRSFGQRPGKQLVDMAAFFAVSRGAACGAIAKPIDWRPCAGASAQ
jgi:hypothetical protein